MKTSRQQYAVDILKQNYPFDDNCRDEFLYGREWRDREKSLSYFIGSEMGGKAGEKAPKTVDEDLLIDILSGMNEYIRKYRAISIFKQKLWDRLNIWIKYVAQEYDISNIDELIDSSMEQPVEEDIYVKIVKSLSGKGATKEELADRFSTCEKTIQNCLHLLDGSLDNGNKKAVERKKKRNPPRFGGQLMQISIKTKDEDILRPDNPGKTWKKIRRFYTPETLHPVAMQLNVTQVGILLKGLQLANDNDVSDNSLHMAIGVWSQLSPYCQERLNEYYHPEDEELHDFLGMVDGIVNDEGSGNVFMTEIDMFEDETISNKINLVFKGKRRCNIKINGKVLKNCTITYDIDRYILHNGIENIIIREEEIEDIHLLN